MTHRKAMPSRRIWRTIKTQRAIRYQTYSEMGRCARDGWTSHVRKAWAVEGMREEHGLREIRYRERERERNKWR